MYLPLQGWTSSHMHIYGPWSSWSMTLCCLDNTTDGSSLPVLFFFLAVSCKSVRYTHSRTPTWKSSALICVRAENSAYTQNVLWEYVHCMSMSPHANRFFYAFHHAKQCRSFAVEDRMQLTDPAAPTARGSFVLIPTHTDSSSHPTQTLFSTRSPPD